MLLTYVIDTFHDHRDLACSRDCVELYLRDVSLNATLKMADLTQLRQGRRRCVGSDYDQIPQLMHDEA